MASSYHLTLPVLRSYIAPTIVTGELSGFPAVSHQTIHPYSDVLLHDMGPDLADGRPDFLASGSEWRTPPLWGLGLVPVVNDHSFLLHDGRALVAWRRQQETRPPRRTRSGKYGRGHSQEEDSRAALEKARLVNKATFRP